MRIILMTFFFICKFKFLFPFVNNLFNFVPLYIWYTNVKK